MKNTETSVGEATCIVYSHTFSNGTKYFGNGVSEKRAFAQGKGKRGEKYLYQFELDSNPQIEIIASGLTPSEADALEQKLFDDYVANGGKALQKRPSGTDLQNCIARANSDEYKIAISSPETKEKMRIAKAGENNPMLGKTHSPETKEKMRIAKTGENHPMFGKTHSPETKEKMRIAILGKTSSVYRKVISMLDGRVTSHNMTTHWNKKNQDYVGTWVDL
jgi:hypothetical protein